MLQLDHLVQKSMHKVAQQWLLEWFMWNRMSFLPDTADCAMSMSAFSWMHFWRSTGRVWTDASTWSSSGALDAASGGTESDAVPSDSDIRFWHPIVLPSTTFNFLIVTSYWHFRHCCNSDSTSTAGLWYITRKWRVVIKKLVPWGTDGRLPLSGDFWSLIVEQSLTFRRASLTNLCLRSNFVWNQIKFLQDTFSSKFKVTWHKN